MKAWKIKLFDSGLENYAELIAQQVVTVTILSSFYAALYTVFCKYFGMTFAGAHIVLSVFLFSVFEMAIGFSFGIRSIRYTKHRKALEALSQVDAQTGLLNRRTFFERVDSVREHLASGAILLIDADNFKLINDTYGHPVGDKVIAVIGEELLSFITRSELCGRVGGEEFAVYLPSLTPTSALRIAENIRRSIGTRRISHEAYALHVTVSIGIAMLEEGMEFHDAWSLADRSLYFAKRLGRNMCVEGKDLPSLEVSRMSPQRRVELAGAATVNAGLDGFSSNFAG